MNLPKGFIFLLVVFLVFGAIRILNDNEQYTKPQDEEPTHPLEEHLDYKCPDCNAIVILIDTLRSDHLPCYGYGLETAPNICKFGEEAILFRNMFSQAPSTKPSVASLFTSTYPSQHKAIYNDEILSEDLVTLAEVLKENGYFTFAVNSNSNVDTRYNYDQGFLVWHDTAWGNANAVNEILFEELKQKRDRPYFMYLHYIDPHYPYSAPEPYYKHFNSDYGGNYTLRCPELPACHVDDAEELKAWKSFYDNEIAFVDFSIGKALEKLKEAGLYESSIIIVMSDHGEMFMEHSYMLHSNGLYAGVINVPLMMKIPDYHKNITIETHVQTMDIFPSILDVLDIKSNQTLMGDSIFPVLDEPDRPIFSEHLRLNWTKPQRSLIMGNYKLIKDSINGEYSLFDMANDESEQRNVLNTTPDSGELVEFMESHIWNIRQYSEIKKNATELDEKSIEQLKSLGYL